ncbi:hypothetical protein BAY60_28355 [Prauserella muralis]|uniref:Uncharacterized protein n=1 Tax=Prauserella muralis TaxID=588067 RepID=A0A2V4AM34_9PSEU|nr:hypothetical protein BAY60_28355 [Prauserella muralis]
MLWHGGKDRGHLIRLANVSPAHTLAEDVLVQYRQNRLSVTRQLTYSDSDRGKNLTSRCSSWVHRSSCIPGT